MTDLAVWKIRKVLQKKSFAERNGKFEICPKCRDESSNSKIIPVKKRRVMAFFIVIVGKGTRIKIWF